MPPPLAPAGLTHLAAWPRSLFARWFLLNSLAQIAILALFRPFQPSLALGSCLWTLVFAALLWHPWVWQWAAYRPRLLRTGLTLWLLWLLLATGYRTYLGGFPDHGTLEFAASEPSYALVLARDRLRWWMLPLGLLPLPAAWWVARGEPGSPWPRPWRWLALAGALGLLYLFDQLAVSPRAMGPDVTTLRMLMETRIPRLGQGYLRRALGRAPVPPGPVPPFNILLLVNESLNTTGQDPRFMPGHGIRAARGEVLAFPTTYASGTMTDVELPALFSGLSPARSSADFHRVPLLWHRARACGMRTALFSIQRMNYHGFPDYLLADGLDTWSSADSLKLPLLNDAGSDDGLLVEQYRQWLDTCGSKPTFTVLHFNATHLPCLQRPGFTPYSEADVARLRPAVLPTRREALARYWNAALYLDTVQERIIELLRAKGLLESTWIIATSDHGESFEGHGRGRMDDLRPEVLQIPLWMRLPAAFPTSWAAALRANTTRLTSNLDVAPTLAQALGQPIPSQDRSGISLLEAFAQERALVAANGGEILPRRPAVAAVIWEEDSSLLQWRWHKTEGSALSRLYGPTYVESAWTPARRERVQAALAAHPVLQAEGVKLP